MTGPSHQPDEDLAIILAALNGTEPPDDMERRLLASLSALHAEAAPDRRRWPLLSLPAPAPARLQPRLLALLTLAAMLVLTLSVAFFHPHLPFTATTTLSANRSPARTSAAPPQRDQSLSYPQSGHSTGVPDERTCSLGCSQEPPPLTLNHGVQRRPRTTHVQAGDGPTTHLASFPAPPMPLTAQEKLLLRVAHAENTQGSPALNLALRASLAARDSEDFQIFFAPATTIRQDQPPD